MIKSTYSYPGQQSEISRGGVLVLLFSIILLDQLRNVFGDWMSIGGMRPDLVLAAVVAAGIYRGRDAGFWLGMAAGLEQDLSSLASTPIGQLMLVKASIGWIAGGLSHSVRRDFILVPVLLIASATVADVFFIALLGGLDFSAHWSDLAASIMVNIVYGVPVYYAVGRIPGGMRS